MNSLPVVTGISKYNKVLPPFYQQCTEGGYQREKILVKLKQLGTQLQRKQSHIFGMLNQNRKSINDCPKKE